MKVVLKGVAKASAKGRTYYYAWRGGPRLLGRPGSPEFIASYREAHDNLGKPDSNRFRSLLIAYKVSDYKELAWSTRKNWSPWLDRIAADFGDLRIAQFDRPEKIRPAIRKWRNRYSATPRSADYGIQVLSRVLSFAVEQGKIASNPCEGIKSLYEGSNRAEIIWLASDIEQLKAANPPEIGQAVDLAATTGLRLGDLLRLSWSHVGSDAIVLATGKSRWRREVVIPLYDDLLAVLSSIPKRATIVLTNSRRQPWTEDGFGSSFNKAKKRASIGDLHFHDLRGTAATRFYIAGLPERVIAEIMGWEETYVAKIIRRYVGRTAATQAVIRQLNRTESGTKTAKLPAKPAS